jgi:SAM-dependent methyltransferase
VYERHLVPAMFASWAPLLVDAVGVRPGERVLDLARGTGIVARVAAHRLGEAGCVVGLDVNAAMLDMARSLPPVPGAAIEWREANALAMPFADATFDVVLCQQGLQQFPDRPRALAEIHRVLGPAGRFAASVWSDIARSPGMAALVEALERRVGTAAADNRRAPFALSDASELDRLVNEAAFHHVSVRTVTGTARFPSPAKLVEYQLAATPFSTLGGMSDQALVAVIDDVSAALRDFVTDDGLAVPMEAHLVIARKGSAT